MITVQEQLLGVATDLGSRINFIDVVCLVVFLIFLAQGFKLGFVRIVGGLLSFVVTVYVSIVASEGAARFTYDSLNLRERVTTAIQNQITVGGVELTGQALLNSLNEFVGSYRFLSPILSEFLENNVDVVNSVLSNSVGASGALVNSIVGSTETVILFALRVVWFVFIAMFVYVIALVVCKFIAKVVAYLPVISSVNSLFGAVLGGVGGLCAVVVVLGVAFMVVNATGGVGVLTSESLYNSIVFQTLLQLGDFGI